MWIWVEKWRVIINRLQGTPFNRRLLALLLLACVMSLRTKYSILLKSGGGIHPFVLAHLIWDGFRLKRLCFDLVFPFMCSIVLPLICEVTFKTYTRGWCFLCCILTFFRKQPSFWDQTVSLIQDELLSVNWIACIVKEPYKRSWKHMRPEQWKSRLQANRIFPKGAIRGKE